MEKPFNPLRIGIVDSGIGGLTVASAIHKKIPDARIVYVCDNQNFPYGPRSENEVREIIVQLIGALLAQKSLDLIVIACNTASTLALADARRLYSLPIVGVVPAIKPAAMLTSSEAIGLLATPATAQSVYIDSLIESFALGKKVVRVGSTKLVEMAEDKFRGKNIDLDEVKKITAEFYQDASLKIDQIVLGCTHFPWLVRELEQAAPWKVHFMDASSAVAQRVVQLSQDISPSFTKTGMDDDEFGIVDFLFTKKPKLSPDDGLADGLSGFRWRPRFHVLEC